MKHFFRVLFVTTFLLFLINTSAKSQISSFDSEVKINYLYGELGASEYGANIKAGYTWSLYEILNTDFSLGIGLRYGGIYNPQAISYVGLQPTVGYQIYTENRMFEPQVIFDVSDSMGFGVGINTTFNRFLVGANIVMHSFDDYIGLKIGYTFPKTISPSF